MSLESEFHNIDDLTEIRRLTAELAAAEERCTEYARQRNAEAESAKWAWKNTREIDKARMDQAKRLAQAEALLRAAVTPHAFNCGWIRHPDFIKMVPVYECTCGLDAFLAASGEQTP